MKIHLSRNQFTPTETLLFESESCTLYTFTYPSGVEAVRIIIGKGQLIWLPFFGQSLWSWKLDGVEQKFEGFVQEPDYQARNFLHTYGGFLIHCGITAMGNPTPEDNHLHHGELPLAHYQEAWISVAEGAYPLTLSGSYTYSIPFIASYKFTPSLHVAADGASIAVNADVQNLQKTALSYMYLNHLNFTLRGAKSLLYGSEAFTKERVTVLHEAIPGSKENPSLLLNPNAAAKLSPELVALVKNKAQYGSVTVNTMEREDGTCVWMALDSSTLDHTVIWLTKTPDRLAGGFSLPATAGPRGLAEETRQGNNKSLGAGESVTFQFVFGLNKQEDTETIQKAIQLLGGNYD